MAGSKKRVTLSDIAKALELSKGTVSLALRDSANLKPETVARVKAMARQLGYQPHPRFRTLATLRWETGSPRDETIAILLSSRKEVHAKAGWLSAEKRAAEMGYRTEFFETNDYYSLKRLQQVLYHRGITGIFFPNYCRIRAEPGINWNSFACVAAGDRNDHLGVDLVRPNPFDSVSLAWRKVYEQGWRRIGGYFPHDPQGPSVFDIKRVAAFEFWQRHDLEPQDLIPVQQGVVNDFAGFNAWFAKYRPEALISLIPTVYVNPDYQISGNPRPAVAVVKGGGGIFSGCPTHPEAMQIAAINWLDQKIRHGWFGASPQGEAHVMAPAWHDGESLWAPRSAAENCPR